MVRLSPEPPRVIEAGGPGRDRVGSPSGPVASGSPSVPVLAGVNPPTLLAVAVTDAPVDAHISLNPLGFGMGDIVSRSSGGSVGV